VGGVFCFCVVVFGGRGANFKCMYTQHSFPSSKLEESLPYSRHWPCQRTGSAGHHRHFCGLPSGHDSAAGLGDGCRPDLWNTEAVFTSST